MLVTYLTTESTEENAGKVISPSSAASANCELNS
jgi:hypothetical protein